MLRNLEQSYNFAFIQQFTHTNLRVIYLPVLQAIKFYGEIIRYKVKTMESVLSLDKSIREYYSSSNPDFKIASKDSSTSYLIQNVSSNSNALKHKTFMIDMIDGVSRVGRKVIQTLEGFEDDDCPAGSVCMPHLNYCDKTTGGNSTPSKQCQNGAKPCCMPLGPAPAPPASPTPAPPASPTPYCADPSNCKHRPATPTPPIPATPTPPIPATPTPAGSASDKKYVMDVPIYGPPTELPKISTNPLNFPAAFINDLAGINPNTNITHLNLAFFSYNNLANTNLGNTNLGSSFIRRSDGKGNYYYNNPVHLIFLPINESNILWGTDATISNLKKAVNNASIIASIGGEKGWNSVVYTEPPNNTIADANIFSDYIKQYSLDGIDIDWEDPTEGAPKLKQISTVKWVCLYTKTIHDNLPSKNIISHAPQAPYFGLGYENIHTTCGNIIDYYNIQYYNQGTNCTYNSFDTIIQNPGCWANSSAVNQIKTMYNVPLSKIIIGKPVLGGPPPTGDADNTGYITQQVFTSILTKCSTDPTCKNIGGIMGWRWHPGQNGEWITSLRKALEPGK